MNKRTINALSQNAHRHLAATGAANGIGNRARTFRSKRDKHNDPKLQRKSRNWMRGE